MHIDLAFPSKYLKAADLPEEGSQAFTISKVRLEEVGKEKGLKKLVLSFNESDKDMICNKTNANTIAKITGSKDTDNWPGTIIALYRTEVEFSGELVESIRVRLKSPQTGKQATANVEHDYDTKERTQAATAEREASEDPF